MAKYYAVWAGRQPGIYESWEECKAQVDKFANARYKKLNATTKQEAIREFTQDIVPIKTSVVKVSPLSKKVEKPVEKVLTVDGAANGVCCEYQAVWTTGEKAFSSAAFKSGTNNIAEFLGLVSAIRYLHEKNFPLIVYTDSVTAMAWVRDKTANTTARQTGKITHELEQLIIQAESYLKMNDEILKKTKILKWETKLWGEIPADYGRK